MDGLVDDGLAVGLASSSCSLSDSYSFSIDSRKKEAAGSMTHADRSVRLVVNCARNSLRPPSLLPMEEYRRKGDFGNPGDAIFAAMPSKNCAQCQNNRQSIRMEFGFSQPSRIRFLPRDRPDRLRSSSQLFADFTARIENVHLPSRDPGPIPAPA